MSSKLLILSTSFIMSELVRRIFFCSSLRTHMDGEGDNCGLVGVVPEVDVPSTQPGVVGAGGAEGARAEVVGPMVAVAGT